MENGEVKVCLKKVITNIAFLTLLGSVIIYIFFDKESQSYFLLGVLISLINLKLSAYVLVTKIKSNKIKQLNFHIRVFRVAFTAVIGIMFSAINVKYGFYYIVGYTCQVLGIIIYGLRIK